MSEGIEDLHRLYRPENFDELLGQDHVSKSMLDMEERDAWPHSFLLSGSAGTGKTTTARIIAAKVGASGSGITEVDAASNSGVNDVRALTEGLQYTGFGESAVKVIIIDECQRLSKNAWDALLKSVEEPPSHVYFIFCTTDDYKVPKTIKTRCNKYNFKSVGIDDLCDLIDAVCEDQEIDFTDKMVMAVAREAEGSPREALTLLSVARSASDIEELLVLLESASESKSVIELSRLLIKPPSRNGWKKAIALVNQLEELPVESIRLQILAYASTVALRATNEESAMNALAILEAFSGIWNESEKKAPLLLALGDVLLGE